MELMKTEKPLEFKKGDVTFFIKPKATEYDVFNTIMAGEMKADGMVAMKRMDFNDCILRNFIIGWEGVTIDGKAIPYSWEVFVNGWPKQDENNIFVELVNFIFEKTDYHKKDKELKKG